MHLRAHQESNEEKKIILTKAIIRLADRFKLSRQELSAILGFSASSLTRLFKSGLYIDPYSKEGQLSLLLIRLYRSLDMLFGGNEEQCQLWLRSGNTYLGGKPIQIIQTIEGLVLTVQYLDAIRGKN